MSETQSKDIAPWLTVAEQRKTEALLSKDRIKVAKIEGKAKIKVAKIQSSDYHLARVVLGFFVLLAVLIGAITYGSTRPESPPSEQQIENQRERFELCMEVEDDYEKCEYAGD